MRIGVVCPYSLTIPGGVQGQVLGLARSLRMLGHEVRVLGPCDGPPPDAGVTPLGRSVPTAANGSVAPLAPDPSAQLRTIRALRDEDFEVLHLHEPMAPGPCMTSLIFGEAAEGRHLPRRRGQRRLPLPRLGPEADGPEARPPRGGVARRAGARAPRASAASTSSCSTASRSTASPTDPWSPPQAPTIFFLGRHEPRKGLEVLLAALADLPDELRVWVGGDGPQSDELKARFGHDRRIEWLGRISDEERAARMRGCTVYCSPSVRGESFGMVLLEAMASGCALVASDLDGHRNVATDGVDALLTPVGDASALAKAIRRVLDDDALRSELVAGGRRRAEQLSMARLADRYVAIYQGVV